MGMGEREKDGEEPKRNQEYPLNSHRYCNDGLRLRFSRLEFFSRAGKKHTHTRAKKQANGMSAHRTVEKRNDSRV